MPERVEWDALVSYLSDRSDDRERRLVERWLASAHRMDALQRAMREMGESPAELFQAYDAERAAHWLLARIGPPVRPARESAPKRSRTMLGIALAASILITAGVGVWMWHEWSGQVPAREWVITETGRGQTRELSFPSGTRVVLAAMSRLRVPRGEVSPREMELEGEAFVELGAGQKRPFVLRTRGAEIVDRGTSFVAREYAGDSLARVAVVGGRVVVSARRAERTGRGRNVVAGEIAHASARDGEVVVERGDVEREAAWLRGDLAFEGTPLPEVARTLERWLEVEIRLDSTIATRRFTGRLRTRSVSDVAHILGAVLDARVEQKDSVLSLSVR